MKLSNFLIPLVAIAPTVLASRRTSRGPDVSLQLRINSVGEHFFLTAAASY